MQGIVRLSHTESCWDDIFSESTLRITQIFLCLKLSEKANNFTLVSSICAWTLRSALHLCLSVFDHPWMLTRCLNVSLNSTNFSRLILVLMSLLKCGLFFSTWVSLNEVYFPECLMFTWKTNNNRTQISSQFLRLRVEEQLRLLNMLWLRRSWKSILKVMGVL